MLTAALENVDVQTINLLSVPVMVLSVSIMVSALSMAITPSSALKTKSNNVMVVNNFGFYYDFKHDFNLGADATCEAIGALAYDCICDSDDCTVNNPISFCCPSRAFACIQPPNEGKLLQLIFKNILQN